MNEENQPLKRRTQLRYNTGGPPNYRKASWPDRAVIHMFLEALYIAGREDHFGGSELRAKGRNGPEAYPSMALDYDIPATSPTLSHWWEAARDYHDRGTVNDDEHGHMLSLSTPGHIAAAFAREPFPSLQSLTSFIADQFERDPTHPNITLTQHLMLREFTGRNPALFKPGLQPTMKTLTDEGLTPDNIAELVENNVFVRSAPHKVNRPVEDLTRLWQNTCDELQLNYYGTPLKPDSVRNRADKPPLDIRASIGHFTEAEYQKGKNISTRDGPE